MRNRWLIVILAAVVAIGVVGCGAAPEPERPDQPAPPPSPAPADEGRPTELIVAVPDDAATFDKLFATTPRSTQVILNCYDALATYRTAEVEDGVYMWQAGEVEPMLLESWTVGDDGVTHTLNVRQGVKFASGEEMTAHDIKWMFDRNFGVEAGGGAFMLRVVGLIDGPDAVRVVDDRTLEIVTTHPNPLLPKLMTLSNFSVMCPTTVKQHATDDDPWATDWLAKNTAGAGPYVVESWTSGVEIVLQARPDYWRGPPPIERAVVKIVPSAADRMMLLRTGTVDMAEKLSAEEIESLAGVPDIDIISIPSSMLVSIGMNNEIAPFDDVRVRQAINYSVPYDTIIDAVYYGRAQRARSLIPAGFEHSDPSYWTYDHDLDRARELLAEAGYEDGFSIALAIETGKPEQEAIAIIVRSELEKVGINVNIDKLTAAVYAERRGKKELPFFITENLWWVDDPSYALFLSLQTNAFFNYAKYSNARIDEITTASLVELDTARRGQLFAEAQQILASEVPSVLIAQPNFNVAVRSSVSGYTHFNDELLRFYTIEKE